MSPEHKKTTPKDAVPAKPEPKDWVPPTLKEVIGEYAFNEGGFIIDATATVFVRGLPAAAYIGEVRRKSRTLNLIVLEQAKPRKGGRTVNWLYGSFVGNPIREALAEVGKREGDSLLKAHIARVPDPTARKDLKGKILDDVRMFKTR